MFCKENNAAFTLLEVTLVMGLCVAITAASFVGTTTVWKLGDCRKAQSVLMQVDIARTSWLLDNPQSGYGNVTITKIVPYLPNPAAISLLSNWGYTLDDAGVQSELISVSKLQDRWPVPEFGMR